MTQAQLEQFRQQCELRRLEVIPLRAVELAADAHRMTRKAFVATDHLRWQCYTVVRFR